MAGFIIHEGFIVISKNQAINVTRQLLDLVNDTRAELHDPYKT